MAKSQARWNKIYQKQIKKQYMHERKKLVAKGSGLNVNNRILSGSKNAE